MALGAAYHHYLQLAGDHGTATHALLLGVLIFLVIRLVSARRTGTTSANKRKQQQRLPLPPSPPGKLPIIGHLHLIGAETHISIRDLDAKHGRNGLLLLRIGAVPTLFVSSPSAADAVLRTQDHIFASRPPSMAAEIIRYGPSDVAFVPYGEYWRQGRKLLTTHMLSTKKVQSFRHGRQEEARTTTNTQIQLSLTHTHTRAHTPALHVHFSSVYLCNRTEYTDVHCRCGSSWTRSERLPPPRRRRRWT